MRKFIVGCLLPLLSVFSFQEVKAQLAATQSSERARAAAKIMVVPYSKQGENIQTVLDDNPSVRTAVIKVKEAFDQRGWSTVDFVANLRAAQANSAFTADRQSNFKTELLTGSGADLYVQVDVQNNTDDNGTNITLNLTAFETHTGASFSNQTASSGRFATSDVEKLISKAFEKIQEEFLNNLMVKTDEIRDIGRALVIHFNLDENCALDFDAEVGDGSFLNEVIEEWLAENAFQGRSNLAGIIENKMIFDEVRIPLFDQETDKPYNPNRFANEIIRFLKSKDITATRNIKGQNLFVTIK